MSIIYSGSIGPSDGYLGITTGIIHVHNGVYTVMPVEKKWKRTLPALPFFPGFYPAHEDESINQQTIFARKGLLCGWVVCTNLGVDLDHLEARAEYFWNLEDVLALNPLTIKNGPEPLPLP